MDILISIYVTFDGNEEKLQCSVYINHLDLVEIREKFIKTKKKTKIQKLVNVVNQ